MPTATATYDDDWQQWILTTPTGDVEAETEADFDVEAATARLQEHGWTVTSPWRPADHGYAATIEPAPPPSHRGVVL